MGVHVMIGLDNLLRFFRSESFDGCIANSYLME